MENIDMMNEKDRNIARKIAEMYLEKHPREDHYGIKLVSSDDDSEDTFYHTFTSEELAILRQYKEHQKEDDITLNEYLELEGHEDLLDKCVQNNSPFQLDLAEDVDLEKPLHFTRFSMYVINEDGTMRPAVNIPVPITDEQYLTLMSELIYHSNRYSVNLLLNDHPELAQTIMSHMAYTYYGIGTPLPDPFACEMVELKASVKSILDPFIDCLNLFNSAEQATLDFMIAHQISPKREIDDIYTIHKDTDLHYCNYNFIGTKIEIFEQVLANDGEEQTYDDLQIDAFELMKKFGLEKPEDISSYLHEHYNFIGGYAQLRKDLGV